MRISKKKSSLALALMALLTVVVGVAWAVTLVDFEYHTTYAPADLTFTFIHSAGGVLPANTDLGATGAGEWGDTTATMAFNPNVLSVTGTPIDQNVGIIFANSSPFTKKGTGTLIFSVANTAGTTATDVTAGTLEVQNNDSIGMGAITVASGATFIANADMDGRDVNNSGLISVSAGKWFQVESTTGAGNATINNNADLVFNASTVNNWKISGTTTAEIIPTTDLTLSGDNSGFNGTIVPLTDNTTIEARTASALGSGSVDLTGRTGIHVIYDAPVSAGTVPTRFTSDFTNHTVHFFTLNPLTLTGDSSAFYGSFQFAGGPITLSGAKIGTTLDISITNPTLILKNGAEVDTNTASLAPGSVLAFDLTGTAPKFTANTLTADATSVIDITLNTVPTSGYLDFTVTDPMVAQPSLTISDGFIAQWDGNRIKITADSNNPAPSPNVSPATARFDGSNPMDLKFLLRGAALTASNNEKLRIYADAVLLTNSSYAIEKQNMTLLASFLKTLADGNHTITLMNDTAQVGKITLTITNGGNGIVDGGGSSGCNAGAVFPMALMLLAPLALLHKKD